MTSINNIGTDGSDPAEKLEGSKALNTDGLPTAPMLVNARHAWRKQSRTSFAMSVKRSQSIPNVHQVIAVAAPTPIVASISSLQTRDEISQMAAQYSSDKKRNKLGYHRTSVACGHCRRRKIRCLLAKDDPQGRCSNCIRLKKECNFYPVETSDRRPRSASKPELPSHRLHDNPDTSSSTSSPPHSPLPRLEQRALTSFPDVHSNYSSSLPLTPGLEFAASSFEDHIRHNSISSTSRLSVALSSSASRRPSLVHMYTSPLPSKEFGTTSDSGIAIPEGNMRFCDRYSEFGSGGTAFDNASPSLWRVSSAPAFPSDAYSPLLHVDISTMPSLNGHQFQRSGRFSSETQEVDANFTVSSSNFAQNNSLAREQLERETPYLFPDICLGNPAVNYHQSTKVRTSGESPKESNNLHCTPQSWAQSTAGRNFDGIVGSEDAYSDTWFLLDEGVLPQNSNEVSNFLASPLQSPVEVSPF